MQQRYVLLNGEVIPVAFPYLDVLMQGRPRHDQDDFCFRHPQMEQGKRAKLFAPFDALDGYSESLSDKNILYTEKTILDESEKEELNRRLMILHALTINSRLAKKNHLIVSVEYYVPCLDEHSLSYGIRGRYVTETGVVHKVDMEVGHTITINEKRISFEDILSIKAADPRLFDSYMDDEISYHASNSFSI